MSFLRRYALWIILATLACTAGGWAAAGRQPIQFTTAAAVDVEANIVTGAAPVAPNLATEQQVATSGSVLSTAATQLGVSPDELHLSVTNRAGTNILLIACSAATASAATNCANTVAGAYRDYRNETGSSAAVQAHDPLHVTIVTTAPPASAKATKRKAELLALGVIFGLALGVGTAFLRDRFDDRVRDRGDLERCLNAPVLSDIPVMHHRHARPEVGVLQSPQSALAEAYRHLRARLSPLLAATDSRGKVVLVTSAKPGEGRTSVAINLAAVIALTGTSVLLVDADLRNRGLSGEFQATKEAGLTDLLADQAKIREVIRSTDFRPGLTFMAAGTVTDRPADLFDTARLRRVFSQLTVLADVVVVDSGPVRTVSDPLALVPVTDIVMMVADVRRTRRGPAAAAVHDITGTGTVTLVGVLNRVRQPWRRDQAPAKGSGPVLKTFVSTIRDINENDEDTLAGQHDRTPPAWRRIPAAAGRPELRPIIGHYDQLPYSDKRPIPRDDEPTMFIEKEPARDLAAAPGPVIAESNGSTGPNGSASGDAQPTAGPPPSG